MAYFAKSWRYFLVGSMLTVLFSSVPAQTENTRECDSFECFQLYTACHPIDLVVENLPSGADDIGLQKQAVINAAESRLRSARIYDPSAWEYLYVQINIASGAFGIILHFNKVFTDRWTSQTYPATTWTHGGIGTHGGNSQYILGVLSEYLDAFLVDFLRVNEPACNDMN